MRRSRFQRRLVSALLVAFALALVLGCAGGLGGRPVASEPERRAYHAAVSQLQTNPAAAERQLEVFLQTFPDGVLAPKASARLGTLARKRGDIDLALARYYETLERYPGAEDNDLVRLRIAQLEIDRGNPVAAQNVLGRARISRLSTKNKRAAYRALADSATDPVARLRALTRLRVLEEDEAALVEVDAEIDALIGGLDALEVLRAADQLGDDIPAARVALRRANLALDAGDFETAAEALDRAASLPRTPATERGIENARQRLALRRDGPLLQEMDVPTFAEAERLGVLSTERAAGTLGVVLPLSGPFARFGQASLEGVLLAAGIFGPDGRTPSPSQVRLLVRDSAGHPERAAAAVRELAADPSVSAIVGPLLKDECDAAAFAAEEAGVPLIALTAHTAIATPRINVFRVRTRPEEETRELVERAMNEFEAQRFAIFYPRDAYGRGLRGLFWDAVEDRGGHVVAVASYDPNATDFADPIRSLVGYTMLSNEQKALIEEREEMRDQAKRLPPEEALALREEARALTTEDGEPLPPIVDFDALFIPESHEKVVLIAPQLAFHEVTGARLLGASGWYDPDLVRIGREHVADAIFTAQYYGASPMASVRDFERRYREAFDAEPDDLGAQAFDAATLALLQLARGRVARTDVRDGLLDVRGYPGVSGVLSIGIDGNAHKRPFLLGVVDGRIQQIN